MITKTRIALTYRCLACDCGPELSPDGRFYCHSWLCKGRELARHEVCALPTVRGWRGLWRIFYDDILGGQMQRQPLAPCDREVCESRARGWAHWHPLNETGIIATWYKEDAI